MRLAAERAAGASEHAVGFATRDDVLRVDAALTALAEEMRTGRSAVVSVVGGGCAGVELATCVAERLGANARVQLLTPSGDILPVCSSAAIALTVSAKSRRLMM